MNIEGLLLPLDRKLNEILTAIIIDHDLGRKAFTVNFRDPDYSAESGGFHPVEIRVDHRELIQYITDFSYVGMGAYAELAKEIDFDFQNKVFAHMGREYSIKNGVELFKIWQKNFVQFYRLGVYEMEISVD